MLRNYRGKIKVLKTLKYPVNSTVITSKRIFPVAPNRHSCHIQSDQNERSLKSLHNEKVIQTNRTKTKHACVDKTLLMSDKTSLSLHTLPVDLVYRILDHLDQWNILYSMRNVCTRINAITDTYRPYKVIQNAKIED